MNEEEKELYKAKKFLDHIQDHLKDGEHVICKICNKTVDEIYEEAVATDQLLSEQEKKEPTQRSPGKKNDLDEIPCRHCNQTAYKARKFTEGWLYYCLSCGRGTLLEDMPSYVR